MPTPKAYGGYTVDLGLKYDGADWTNSDIVNIAGICPFAGTIREIWVGVGKALPTTATLNVYKAASTNISLLTGGTALNLQDKTVNVATSVTLVTTGATLKVAAGEMLIATYTLTSITAGDDSALCCTVIVEPDTW